MPECKHCGENIPWDEQFNRHENEWCDERPDENQQTLTEVKHA
ncbi:hypothetical protein ACODNH_05065 [Haloarcula sp. NS06]|nr:hypothetical protein [Haloarcula sp. H-GB4]MDQ2072870.1 hypothetical protein [Haloarcula sp. H-GB4]